jgi:hypothetical protein
VVRPSLPPDLEDINRMLKLWAAGEFDVGPATRAKHPLETIREMQEGAFIRGTPVPEPAELAEIDKILLVAPSEVSALVKVWYRNDLPVVIKADRLGISRSSIYNRWNQALRYLQGAMKARGVRCIA